MAEESNHASLASAALALGVTASLESDPDSEAVLARLTEHDEPLVAGAAQAARLFFAGEVDERACDNLLKLIVVGQIDRDAMPWSYGRVDKIATRQLLAHVSDGRRVMAELLLRAVVETKGEHALASEWAGGTLEMTFERSSTLLESSALTAEQRTLLETLAAYSVQPAAAAYGLPSRSRDVRRWLGLEPAGALDVDSEIAGEPVRPLWQAMHAMQKRGEHRAIYDRLGKSLSGEALLAAYGEWLVGAYGLNPPFMGAGWLPDGEGDGLLKAALAGTGDDAAAAWGRATADALIEDSGGFSLGKGPPRVGNLTLIAMARSGEPPPARYDELASIGGELGRGAFEVLPMDRREAIVLACVNDPDRPARTEDFVLAAMSSVFDLVKGPKVAKALLGLVVAIEESQGQTVKRKAAAADGRAMLEAAAKGDDAIAAVLG